MTTYNLRCYEDGGEEEVQASSMAEACGLWTKWMEHRDWQDPDRTILASGVAEEITDEGDVVASESMTYMCDPLEPRCGEYYGDHNWQAPHGIVGGFYEHPGVFCHEGSVIIHEVCVKCGCARISDYRELRADAGEQGFMSIRYVEGKYADEVAALLVESV